MAKRKATVMERHLGGNVKYSVGVARAKCQGICLN